MNHPLRNDVVEPAKPESTILPSCSGGITRPAASPPGASDAGESGTDSSHCDRSDVNLSQPSRSPSDVAQFRANAHRLVDWMADYMATVQQRPVRAQVAPGQIAAALPNTPAEEGSDFNTLLTELQQVLLPGMTHWQHPRFFAYFPANSSPPSVLGEMAAAALGAQCMSWETSPAATELEERATQWLRQLLDLPEHFEGVLQDGASEATLVALLTARERAMDPRPNHQGLFAHGPRPVYTSVEAHSSVAKAVRILGLGETWLRAIPTGSGGGGTGGGTGGNTGGMGGMDLGHLAAAMAEDAAAGRRPLAVVATLGSTGVLTFDDLQAIAPLCRAHGAWLHVDAAYAGSALILPEYRSLAAGLKHADSFVFNPHKWLLTNFDCSAYYVADRNALLQAMSILPEYLKTDRDGQVHNYRDWGIPLGRRFRALKLWWVLRSYGAAALRATLREHIRLAHDLARRVATSSLFQLATPPRLNMVCFRLRNGDDAHTAELMHRINKRGVLYLTHTRHQGRFVLRLVVGQTNVNQAHVDIAWEELNSQGQAALRDAS